VAGAANQWLDEIKVSLVKYAENETKIKRVFYPFFLYILFSTHPINFVSDKYTSNQH